MRKKSILTILFVISLLPMLLRQYGTSIGINDTNGISNLCTPMGFISVPLFIIGVWISFKNKKINTILGGLGTIGIVISEIYNFFTWHTLTITGKIGLFTSMHYVFPGFYIGLIVSLIMVFIYFYIDKRIQ